MDLTLTTDCREVKGNHPTRSPETQHASVSIPKTKEQAVKEAKM